MKTIFICALCGTSKQLSPSSAARAKTCGARECVAEHCRRKMTGNTLRAGHRPGNGFEAGHAPWNRGAKGIRLSPATEFKKGQPGRNWLPVGSVRIRTFKRDGNQRAFIKLAEPNIWKERAIVVWENANGPVPKGMIVHHRDRATLHDDITNLELQTRAQHLLEHRPEFELRRRAALARRIAA
jgi:hypothetical protein